MIEEIAKNTFNQALKHTDQVEIFIEQENSIDIEIEKDKADFAKEVQSLGVGLRVIKDDKMGFAYTSDLKKISETIEQALFNAKANEIDKDFNFSTASEYPKIKGYYDPRIPVLSIEEILEFAQNMISQVKECKCQPTSGRVKALEHITIIQNSEGTYCKDKGTFFSGSISVNIPDKNGVSTAYEGESSRKMDVDPYLIAKKACENAVESRNGKKIETINLPVILDHHAASDLLSTFSQAFSADNVQRGRSFFAGKEGEKVVSSELSIYDDGTLSEGLNTSLSDGEGVPSQKTLLIEDGVLKNFIYDLYTASKGKVQSTGNGMRESFADIPSVSFSNLIIDFKDQETIEDIRNGILVTNVLGAHTANPISGDFSVEAMNAFKIENGEKVFPIKKAMISGNIFQAMKESAAASKEIRKIGYIVTPSIRINELRVVG